MLSTLDIDGYGPTEDIHHVTAYQLLGAQVRINYIIFN